MKDLYLIRHAKSSWTNAGEVKDIDRALSVRGVNDAHLMARFLFDNKLKFDKIYSSNGIRALHTAVIMARGIGQEAHTIEIDENLYLASPQEILQVIRRTESKIKRIAVFTHNPGITSFAWNIGADLDNVATAGIVKTKIETGTWEDLSFEDIKFQSYEYPKKYR